MGNGLTHLTPVQEHVFASATDVCIHCYVPKRNVEASVVDHKPITCVYRWVDAPPPTHRPIHRAADDFDMIGARLAQLRDERDEAERSKVVPDGSFLRAIDLAFERSAEP